MKVNINDKTEDSQQERRLTVSISKTVLKAFSDIPEIGAKKFPAAPNDKKIIKICESSFLVDDALQFNSIQY